MLKLISVVLSAFVLGASGYNIITRPSEIADFYCPTGYVPFDLIWDTRLHWTLSKWSSTDSPYCAIADTQADCYKPNGASKFWMTFFSGYAEFRIEKWDSFSFSSTGYTSMDSGPSAPPSQQVSDTLIPWYFTVNLLAFRVRGATRITIIFSGPIYREIILTDAILDYRLITFVAIEWPEFPVIYNIEFIFIFPHRQKVKFWDLYINACCEILTTAIGVGK